MPTSDLNLLLRLKSQILFLITSNYKTTLNTKKKSHKENI